MATDPYKKMRHALVALILGSILTGFPAPWAGLRVYVLGAFLWFLVAAIIDAIVAGSPSEDPRP